jgi:hypothetical protein
MTARDAVLIAALLFLGVGVRRDITRSQGDKGGWRRTVGRHTPTPIMGRLLRGLPWYLAGSQLLAIVAWGNW